MEAEAALQICSITTGARIFSAQLRPSQGRTHPQRAGLTTHIPHWTSFFALQIFFPRILRFPPTRPVPAAVTDVSRVCWCKSDAGKPQKSAWVCFALVCGAFFALAARGSHWIERKEEVKCNKCPEFFLSAVLKKVQCATALFCQPPATMHLQMRQFSAGRSKSMKPPHVSSLFALGMVQILGGPDGGSRPRTPQRSQSRDGASAQLRIRADVESLQHTCVILEAPARHRSTSHQNESKLGAVPQSCFSLQHPN